MHSYSRKSKFITAPCLSGQYISIVIKIVHKELWAAIAGPFSFSSRGVYFAKQRLSFIARHLLGHIAYPFKY